MKTPAAQPVLEISEIHLALLESFPAKLQIGEEIVVEETQLGQMVSVVLPESRAFETLTLLVPVIHLPQECRESAMQTTAILSRRVKVKEGQAQSYQTIALAGAAQQVAF